MPIADPRLAFLAACGALLLAALLLAAPGPPARRSPRESGRRARRRRADDSPGCLTELARYAGVLLGALAPVVILLAGQPFSWPLALAAVAGVVLGSGAVTLAATGWLALLRRGPDPVDTQLEVTGTLFDLTTYTSMPLNAGPKDLDDCLGIALLLLIGGLFLLGIVAGGLVAERLLPAPTTTPRRLARGALCFAYAAVFVAGIAGLLRVVAV